MARYKDQNWNLPGLRLENWEQVGIAVLMDIRDELKRLNGLLRCPNFLDIPHKLESIRQNTVKPRKKTKLKLAKKRAA